MYISIDLGGTKTRIASSTDLQNIHKVERFSTLHDPSQEKEKLILCMQKVSDGKEIKGICVGVPGQIDEKEKKFGFITNIPTFNGLGFNDLLGDVNCKVVGQNDAALAGLAEANLGAGVGYGVVAYLTLSTGVGGIRISGGKIDPNQKVNEPGHMIIYPNGRYLDSCMQNGCFEAYCSGNSFLQLYNVEPALCTDQEIWDRYAKDLAVGITNVLAMWSPDIVVLGGSMTNQYDDYFEKPLTIELLKQTFFKTPPIVRAKLGDDAGLYGGFVYMKS